MKKSELHKIIKEEIKNLLEKKPEKYEVGDELVVSDSYMKQKKIRAKKGLKFKYKNYMVKLVEPAKGFVTKSEKGWWAEIIKMA